MKHIIIGTAGHVDHGKTCLTLALTGKNTDRLKEEQKRGITIEIGFAQLVLPNGQTASIIDVPGHEKFIRNMLVGASGMDVVLLVIAADEGFMPQTREHLGILSLLGVKHGIIVITKADMVEEEWLEAIEEEAREEVSGTFLEDAPMIPVSSFTGMNIDKLKEMIVAMVEGAEQRNQDHPFRIPIDRIFTVDGFGTVITGTLTEGTIHVGDDVMIYPKEKKARVRSLQVHDKSQDAVGAGQRVAVNLSGVDKADLSRGDTLAKPGSMNLTRLVDVRLDLLKDSPFSIKHNSQLHFHHSTREILCRVVLLDRDKLEPGETCYAQLKLIEPLAAKNGDHFVVRFFSPAVTVGGGLLLNVSPTHHKRFDEAAISGLTTRDSGSSSQQVLQSLNEFGAAMPTPDQLAHSCSLSPVELAEVLAQLKEDGDVTELSGYLLSSAAAQTLWEKTQCVLTGYHKAEPFQDGMNRGEFRGKLLPKAPVVAVDALIDYFAQTHGLQISGPTVALPGFQVVFTPVQEKLRDKIDDIYRKAGLTPGDNAAIEQEFGKDAPLCRQIIARMVTDGTLVAVNTQLRFHQAHYDRALDTLYEIFSVKKEMALAEFRDALQISRKYALALLEYWDSNGITRKVGDVRVLLKNRS